MEVHLFYTQTGSEFTLRALKQPPLSRAQPRSCAVAGNTTGGKHNGPTGPAAGRVGAVATVPKGRGYRPQRSWLPSPRVVATGPDCGGTAPLGRLPASPGLSAASPLPPGPSHGSRLLGPQRTLSARFNPKSLLGRGGSFTQGKHPSKRPYYHLVKEGFRVNISSAVLGRPPLPL